MAKVPQLHQPQQPLLLLLLLQHQKQGQKEEREAETDVVHGAQDLVQDPTAETEIGIEANVLGLVTEHAIDQDEVVTTIGAEEALLVDQIDVGPDLLGDCQGALDVVKGLPMLLHLTKLSHPQCQLFQLNQQYLRLLQRYRTSSRSKVLSWLHQPL